MRNRGRGGDIPKNDACRADEWGLGAKKAEKAGPRPHVASQTKVEPNFKQLGTD